LEEYFIAPVGDGLLSAVQRSFLHANLRELKDSAITFDGSLRVHACPSKRREIEVLYHQLLTVLALDSELDGDDVLVMAPRLEEYIPYIHAVFGGDGSNGSLPPLPFK